MRHLDLEDSVALVEEANPPYSTIARDTTAISVLETDTEVPWGDGAAVLRLRRGHQPGRLLPAPHV